MSWNPTEGQDTSSRVGKAGGRGVKMGVKKCAKSLECVLSAVKSHWGIRIWRGHARIDM